MATDTAELRAFTVDDVWRVRGDWRAMAAAARATDAGPVAGELLAAAEALRRGQELLSGVLERVEVPMAWQRDGRLTFFPHDPADLAVVRAAMDAAEVIHGRVAMALARHHHAITASTD